MPGAHMSGAHGQRKMRCGRVVPQKTSSWKMEEHGNAAGMGASCRARGEGRARRARRTRGKRTEAVGVGAWDLGRGIGSRPVEGR